MNWFSFFIGIGLLAIGFTLGSLVAEWQLEEALKLLKEAKRMHEEINDAIQRFRELPPR
jgi:hypothetical protein